MAGDIHEIAIRRILQDYPGAETRGFMKAIRRAICPAAAPDFKNFGVIPDAFVIDREKEIVTVIEVEGGHPVSAEKMGRYCDLWWALSYIDWDLILVAANRWGSVTSVLDVGDYAIEKIVRDARHSNWKPDPATVQFVAALREPAGAQ